MNVASIMTTRVATVEMDDSLRVINGIFCAARFHHLLVVDNDRLVGVISDRDLLKASSPFLDTAAERPQDVARLGRKVHQIMTRTPITIHRDTSIAEAVEVLLKKNVSCLPVVTRDQKIEGIVTWKDLLRTYTGIHADGLLECRHCGSKLESVLDQNPSGRS